MVASAGLHGRTMLHTWDCQCGEITERGRAQPLCKAQQQTAQYVLLLALRSGRVPGCQLQMAILSSSIRRILLPLDHLIDIIAGAHWLAWQEGEASRHALPATE
ncbi:hypothetical protein NDU88_004896 [Pleurodeles waltl]|uniref:Uncharacterized protein n=1 Tax=Pleurodeles waltl TaxID=8319 RepID=A0AAV7KZP0_PLEWA|nr:hypothetical protein NDU88_004896 [Pleurodeles waltl]